MLRGILVGVRCVALHQAVKAPYRRAYARCGRGGSIPDAKGPVRGRALTSGKPPLAAARRPASRRHRARRSRARLVLRRRCVPLVETTATLADFEEEDDV